MNIDQKVSLLRPASFSVAQMAALTDTTEDEVMEALKRVSPPTDPEQRLETLMTRVEDYESTINLQNCLFNAGITFTWQLATKSETQLLRSRGLGRKVLAEIREHLKNRGLWLGMNPEDEYVLEAKRRTISE
jgi:DNA-directed RNA polymerase alpha subunit